MNAWRDKLDRFLSDFEHSEDIVGILVCGSYITGHPSSHSDLDVHLVLDDRVNYRERGNKIVDGLPIEYFANPPRQILAYFDGDLEDRSLMSQTQFATGEILLDIDGVVLQLKQTALAMMGAYYKNETASMPEMTKYGLWNMLDDLQDAYENNRPDFDFLYFNLLNMAVSDYLRCINRPYHLKAICGHITSDVVRKKYLLRELPDAPINDLIIRCIVAAQREEKMASFQRLTEAILQKFGGFEIDGFKLKSDVEV